jgi:hypothetical protein
VESGGGELARRLERKGYLGLNVKSQNHNVKLLN